MPRGADEDDLDRWMARLSQGERSAFEPLFAALLPRARRLATFRLGETAGEDVAQSALLKVFSHASEFEPGRAVLPWFYAIVSNEVRMALRSRRVTVDVESTALVSSDDPEAQLIEAELQSALARAVDSLDAASMEAIGAMLGERPRPVVESAAFRKRVSRAYARLRCLLVGGEG